MPFIVKPLPDPAGKKHMGGIHPRHTCMPPWPRGNIFTLSEDAVAVDEGGVHNGGEGDGRGDRVVAAEDVPGVAVDKACGTKPRALFQKECLGTV